MTIDDALQLHRTGRLAEAEQAYRRLLAGEPNHHHALHFLGVLKAQAGDMAAAVDLIARSLALHGDNPPAEFHLAEALYFLGRLGDATAHYRRAIAGDGEFVAAYGGLARALLATGALGEALAVAEQGLKRDGRNPDLLAQAGDILRLLQRGAEAQSCYSRALEAAPDYLAALLGVGYLRLEDGLYDDALAAFDTAATAHPAMSEPLTGRAIVLGAMGRLDEALQTYSAALGRDPANEQIYYNLGCALLDGGQLPAALSAFDSALAVKPDYVEALYNRAFVLDDLGRLDDALTACDQVLAVDPDASLAASKAFLLRARRCDWSGVAARRANLKRLVEAGHRVDPYTLAIVFDDPALLHRAATQWASPPAAPMPVRPLSPDRLRIAYLSPNFHEHPVAHQAVGVFEAHDRSRFETFGVCVASGPDTAVRMRLKAGFEHFVDAGRTAPRELAAMLHQRGIDIIVDLAGYTIGGRTAALRFRPAPLAVAWLGFPGTTGASYVDYLIADPVIVPPGAENHYSEKIVRLPFSYMPRDGSTPRLAAPPRRDLGLPDGAFVFCGFNNALKFTPEIFAIWMALLRGKDGSVLWLNSQEPRVRDNLRREAAARGLAPERIVFAERAAARTDHLARLAAADLFLDTVPYGAHSTANDFLWAGVPVVTCSGQSFASRVAAGQLTALGLPELIAPDLAAYQNLAAGLACDPARLGELRRGLAAKAASPLFDSAAFCRALETAFETMAERARGGLAPESFSVS
jgi:protein O-GlcNAc transferase